MSEKKDKTDKPSKAEIAKQKAEAKALAEAAAKEKEAKKLAEFDEAESSNEKSDYASHPKFDKFSKKGAE